MKSGFCPARFRWTANTASTLCLIGAGGAEEIWQLPLSDQEAQALAESCRIIREYGAKAAALSTLANKEIHG